MAVAGQFEPNAGQGLLRTGIPHAIVDGQIMVKDSRALEITAAQALVICPPCHAAGWTRVVTAPRNKDANPVKGSPHHGEIPAASCQKPCEKRG